MEDTSSIDILPDKMQKVASEFQEYLRSSNENTYNPQNYQGHWRQLTVRSTLNGGIMAIVIVMEKKVPQPIFVGFIATLSVPAYPDFLLQSGSNSTKYKRRDAES